MEVKKSLKQLATVSGLETTVSPRDKDIGEEVQLDFTEIMSRTPDHIFCRLLELRLKYLV